MGSRAPALLFAAGLLVRAVLAGVAVVAAALAVEVHYYATALIAAGLAALISLELARAVLAGDRALATFATGLKAGVTEIPSRPLAGFPALSGALREAAQALGQAGAERERRIALLEGLLDTVASALVVLEPDGSIKLANRSARALARHPVSRLAEIEAIGPEVAARLEGLPTGARLVLKIADGRRMLAACSSFSTPGGGVRRLISLHSLSEELAPVELAAWQDLVRTLAHEMMNSLTPVASLSESLERMLAGQDEPAEAAGVIARRSRGLMSFVARYRAVADLPQPEPQPLRLAAFAAELVRLVGPDMRTRGVRVSTRVEPPELQAFADPDLLAQACINLLKNAAEACAATAAPQVELTCALRDGQVTIQVRDNGCGLPEDLERIFVPFFTTKRGGSGIGLTLARQIALAHGGQLQALRNEDGGSTFAIVLPGEQGLSGAPPMA
jgi:nitrogen fixation/metabolism regulation signal transduction histidine kinase